MDEEAAASAFEPSHTQPLRGCDLILTRPIESAHSMAQALVLAGAKVLEAPAIEFADFVEENLDQCLTVVRELSRRQGWLVLPSPAAARYLGEMLHRLHLDASALGGVRLATVGRGSAGELERCGLKSDYISPAPHGRALGETLPAEPGVPIVIAGSMQTRPELRDALLRRGFAVQVLPLYAPRPSRSGLRRIRTALAENPHRILVVTSPSAVDAIAESMQDAPQLLGRAGWVAIGATTLAHLRARGIPSQQSAAAEEPTVAGLVAATRELASHGRKDDDRS